MTRAYFDRVAASWDHLREGFFPNAVREAALQAAALVPGTHALDVGAGTGFVTAALLEAGIQVTALDTSPEMLQRLTDHHPTVHTRLGDAAALPFPDGSYDAVFANMCLHHVDDPPAAIREMARVLRPGAPLVITDLDAHTHRFLVDEHHDRWMGFGRADVARWFRAAGLDAVTLRDTGNDCCATSGCGTERAQVSIFLATGRKPTDPRA